MKTSLIAPLIALIGFVVTTVLSFTAEAKHPFGDSYYQNPYPAARPEPKKAPNKKTPKKAVKRKVPARKSAKKKVANPSKPSQSTKSAKVVKGQFEYVVCTESTDLLVRNESLSKVIFEVKRHEPVKLFQGWGENRRSRVVKGKKYSYVKAQFPEHEGNAYDGIGWVSQDYIKLKSECAGFKEADSGKDDLTKSEPAPNVSITGLNDPNCCNFPLIMRPTASYESGMRMFGARRSGGRRLHAACDLYRRINEPIEAVAPGSVIRNPYYFYQGTYALEVKHAGGFVVRYGEITGRRVKGVHAGAKVRAGQTIAYMGKVNSNCCEPMLHFELYSGRRSGSLTVGGNKYQRRSDLMNPTKFLRSWEERKFGR